MATPLRLLLLEDSPSDAELVLYAVRNEIVHVQLPAVLRFPSPGMAERTLPLKPLTESFVCLDSAGR